MAAIDFDCEKVVNNVIPKGDQRMVISSAELKPTKKPGGMGLNLKFTIVGGPYANRSIFKFINIKNANPEAQSIGEQELKSICQAIGVQKLQDTSDLLNGSGRQISKPLIALIDIRDGDNGKENVVKKFRRIETNATPAAPVTPATEAVAPPAAPVAEAAPAAPWATA